MKKLHLGNNENQQVMYVYLLQYTENLVFRWYFTVLNTKVKNQSFERKTQSKKTKEKILKYDTCLLQAALTYIDQEA